MSDHKAGEAVSAYTGVALTSCSVELPIARRSTLIYGCRIAEMAESITFAERYVTYDNTVSPCRARGLSGRVTANSMRFE